MFNFLKQKTQAFLNKILNSFWVAQLLPKKMRLYLIVCVFVGLLVPLADYFFATILQHSLYFLKVIQVPNSYLMNILGNNFKLCIVFLLVTGIMRGVFSGLKQMISAVLLSRFVVIYRKRVLENFINSRDYNSSDAITLFSEVIPSVGNSVFHFSLMISSFVSLILLIFFSLTISFKVTLLIAFLVLLFWLIMNVVIKKVQVIGEEIEVSTDKISRKFVEGIKNHFLIRVYGKINSFANDCSSLLDSYGKSYFSYSYFSMVSTALPLFSSTIIITLLIYLLGNSFIWLEPEKFLLLIFVLMRASQALGEFSNSLTITSLSKPLIKRLLKIPQKNIERNDIDSLTHEPHDFIKLNSIEIKELNYTLVHNQKKLIQNLSLSLVKGDVLLIKGPSGAGKSTLISLIIGLLEGDSGKILINNENANDQVFRDLRSAIGYVGSEPYFIKGTIADNLLYLISENRRHLMSTEEIWKVLKICNMDDYVKSLPGGLEHIITDSINFSAGQKQRLAIASALVRKPELLILDEATANLDIGNEAEVFVNLSNYLKDHITIIVSHRSSLDHLASKVINII